MRKSRKTKKMKESGQTERQYERERQEEEYKERRQTIERAIVRAIYQSIYLSILLSICDLREMRLRISNPSTKGGEQEGKGGTLMKCALNFNSFCCLK